MLMPNNVQASTKHQFNSNLDAGVNMLLFESVPVG